ncbi:MAG: hypothetical protein CMJ83_13790 [Planctomycetes bacterium]|nr:hypothetical protein [Planctomycetota bacterium]
MTDRDPLPVVPDDLLTHAAFIRGVARGLVGEPGADDLEQDTWLRALEKPPKRGEGLRGWLRTVAQRLLSNQRRGNQRRAGRELRTVRTDAAEATSDIVERQSVLQHVVFAVMRLDEPYRTTVMLRFYEDLAPLQIAERLGIPENTVRSRLRRALDQLRGRLDRQYDGDRTRWMVSLTALVGLRIPIPTPRVPIVAGAVAACVIIGGLLVSRVLLDSDDLTIPDSPVKPSPTAGETVEPRAPAAPVRTHRFLAEKRVTFPVTVTDAVTKRPAAYVEVVAEVTRRTGRVALQRIRTDASGRATVSLRRSSLKQGKLRVAAFAEARRHVMTVPEVTMVQGAEQRPIHLELAVGARYEVRVVDVHGEPAAGVRITLDRSGAGRHPDIAGTPPSLGDRWLAPRFATTDSDGIARVEGLQNGTFLVRAEKQGFAFETPYAIDVPRLGNDQDYILSHRLLTGAIETVDETGRSLRGHFRFEVGAGLRSRGGDGVTRVAQPSNIPTIVRDDDARTLFFTENVAAYTGLVSSLASDLETWRKEHLEGTRHVRVKVVLPGRPPQSVRLPIASWSPEGRPASALVRLSTSRAALQINFPTAPAASWPARVSLTVIGEDNVAHPILVDVNVDGRGTLWLPHGRYRLHPGTDWRHEIVPINETMVDLGAHAQRVSLYSPPELVAVIVRPREPETTGTWPMWVTASPASGRGVATSRHTHTGRATIWLPPGEHAITIAAGGFHAATTRIHIPATADNALIVTPELLVDW